eukprot:CAMPEP_0201626416 /NCGR_PEP_ID=MMETSP0493-20130528/1812_1 /ASSEMBLY_ACC=CAM_ASM_000838 /TAXON_ID=420259 /ORGANISM="Thalassiosira gravida, Strain GMp14c1" /LENGTH=67 /DNA_ID=CAMNT_0048096509 /DNA_START=112 /DNA_END=315 /DNA_ORIENTATION=-
MNERVPARRHLRSRIQARYDLRARCYAQVSTKSTECTNENKLDIINERGYKLGSMYELGTMHRQVPA